MDFIFGTPIWKLESDSFDEKKITEEIYKAKDLDPEGIVKGKSNFGGYHSGYDFSAPRTDAYIKRRLEGEGGLDFPHRMNYRWFNINNKGDSNKPHDHGVVGLSGVLFITDAPGLILHSINKESLLKSLLKLIPSIGNHYLINGKPGEIVIFPSTIMHWVEPNNSDSARITYAFNIEVNT